MSCSELLPPDQMSPDARAREITLILAHAILRTCTPEVPDQSHIPLGFEARKSVHDTPYPEERL